MKTFASIKVRNIEKAVIIFTDNIELKFDIFELINEKTTIIKIKNLFYIDDSFIVKIFIEMNIIDLK